MDKTPQLNENEQAYLTRGKKRSDVSPDSNTMSYAENEGLILSSFIGAAADDASETLNRLDEAQGSAAGGVIAQDDSDDDLDDPDQA